MSEIKTAHKGGDSKRMPTVPGHAKKMQTPGAAAGGVKTGDMSWGGRKK